MTMPAWAEGGLRINRSVLDAVVCDAVRAYAAEEEACGYLLGPAAEPLLCDEHVAMTNLANKLHAIDPERYFRTARSFFAFNEKLFDDAVRQGEATGRPVKVLYHSHLDTGAYFSSTDRAVMSMGQPPDEEGGAFTLGPGPAWPIAFLVTSVRQQGVDEHKLLVWHEGDFEPRPFTIVE